MWLFCGQLARRIPKKIGQIGFWYQQQLYHPPMTAWVQNVLWASTWSKMNFPKHNKVIDLQICLHFHFASSVEIFSERRWLVSVHLEGVMMSFRWTNVYFSAVQFDIKPSAPWATMPEMQLSDGSSCAQNIHAIKLHTKKAAFQGRKLWNQRKYATKPTVCIVKRRIWTSYTLEVILISSCFLLFCKGLHQFVSNTFWSFSAVRFSCAQRRFTTMKCQMSPKAWEKKESYVMSLAITEGRSDPLENSMKRLFHTKNSACMDSHEVILILRLHNFSFCAWYLWMFAKSRIISHKLCD